MRLCVYVIVCVYDCVCVTVCACVYVIVCVARIPGAEGGLVDERGLELLVVVDLAVDGQRHRPVRVCTQMSV